MAGGRVLPGFRRNGCIDGVSFPGWRISRFLLGAMGGHGLDGVEKKIGENLMHLARHRLAREGVPWPGRFERQSLSTAPCFSRRRRLMLRTSLRSIHSNAGLDSREKERRSETIFRARVASLMIGYPGSPGWDLPLAFPPEEGWRRSGWRSRGRSFHGLRPKPACRWLPAYPSGPAPPAPSSGLPRASSFR